MRNLLAASVAILMISGLNTAQADEGWPELFRTAVADFDGENQPHSYEMTVTRSTGDVLYSYAFDPSEDEPIQISDRSDDISEADLRQSLVEEDGDIWCDGMAERVLGDVELVSEDAETATFSFTPTAPPDADDMERRVIERTTGTMVIDKQSEQIRSFSYHLQESFKPVIVARVHAFDLQGACVASASGRAYLSELTIAIDVSAMGMRQTETTIQRVENVEAAL
jgi:hypothetical protein